LVAAAAVLITGTSAQNGPSSLYTLLNGQTFNPPGYTIVMYQSCMQNQNAGNPCGSFSGYQSSNGIYTYQLYGPEAPVSPTCSRTFHLTLACGPTMSMSGVNENPTCVYSATLSLPQVCGVDLTVGAEAASVSPSALPPTSTSTVTASVTATATVTASGTVTETASITSTPLFVITAWPTPSSTSTLTATSTPLFMVTAFPTSSPVNVSASSTPLYFYTPYPSTQSNASGLLAFGIAQLESGSPTAMILGAVAVGIVGIGAIVFTVKYFRSGGTVGGFINKVKEQKGAITQLANALPLSEAQRAQLKTAEEKATSALEKAQATQASVLQSLPPSVGAMVVQKQSQLQNQIMSYAPEPVASVSTSVSTPVSTPVSTTVSTTVSTQVSPPESTPITISAPVQNETPSIIQTVTEQTPTATATATVTHLAIAPEDLEAVRAFLAQKSK
jgi:hypothetical protein